jgi:hypothetical protein
MQTRLMGLGIQALRKVGNPRPLVSIQGSEVYRIKRCPATLPATVVAVGFLWLLGSICCVLLPDRLSLRRGSGSCQIPVQIPPELEGRLLGRVGTSGIPNQPL